MEEDINPLSGRYDAPDLIFEPTDITEKPPGSTDAASAKDVFDSRFLENTVYPSVLRADQNFELRRKIDTSFEDNLTFDKVQQDLKDRGIEDIPEDWYKDIAQSTNDVSYFHALNRVEERLQSEKDLAELGGMKALGVEIASYATDPIGLVVEGAAGVKTAGSVGLRFLRGASRGALSESFLQTVRSSDKTISPKDFAIGVGTSFLISGGIGAWTGEEIKAVKNLTKPDIPEPSLIPNGHGGAAFNLKAEEIDPNVVLPTDSAIDKVSDIMFDEGILESKWKGITFSTRAQGQKVKYKPLQKINEMILGVGIKKDNNAVRRLSILDRQGSIEGKFDAQLQHSYNQEFISYSKEFHNKNAITRQFSGEVHNEFSAKVGRHLLSDGLEEATPQVKSASKGFTKFYQNYAKDLERSGVAKKGTLTNHSDYGMPRVFNYAKARKLQQTIGHNSETVIRDMIEKSIESSRIARNLEIDPKVTKLVAKAYHKRMFTPPTGEDGFKRSDNVLGIDLTDKDFIEELLQGQDATDVAEVIKILDDLKKPPVKGETPRLEHRLPLDLNVSKTLDNGHTVKLVDFFEDDAQKLAYNYGKWASAEIALKERGLSLKDLKNFGEELSAKAAANTEGKLLNGVTKADVQNFDFTHRAIRGLSVEVNPDSTVNRVGRLANSISYMNKMNAAGLNAISEAGTILAAGQLKNIFKRSGALKQLTKDVISGNITDDYIRQVHMLMGGLGDTWARNIASLKHTAEVTTKHGDKLAKVENFFEGGKRIATANNGLAHITDVTRRLSAIQGLDLLDSMAQGRKLPKWWKKRSLDWSLSPKRKKVVTNWLNSTDSVKRGTGGELMDLGLDNAPDDVIRYMEDFIYAFTAHNIQETSKANLPKAFQTPIGKILLQFRSFTAGAWENHVLTDLSFRDSLTTKKFVYTASLGMAMYGARIYMSNPFDKKAREKAMTTDKMLRSGATYAVNAALLPTLIDTMYERVGGDTLIGKQRTSGLQTSLGLGGVPAATIASDVGNVTNIPGDLIRGGELSSEQIKALFSVTLLDSFWQTRGLKNLWANKAPKENTKDKAPLDLNFNF